MPLELCGHPDVEGADPRADRAGDGVCSGAPGAEVLDHRRRDLFGPGRDTAGENTVVTGTDHDRGFFRRWRRNLPSHCREPDAEILQPPEAPRRLGKRQMPLSRSGGCFLIKRSYLPGQLQHPAFERHSPTA